MASLEKRLMTVASLSTVLYSIAIVLAYLGDTLPSRVFIVLASAAFLMFCFLGLSRWAWRVVNNPLSSGPWPRPQWLWATLFNKLPNEIGQPVDLDRKIEILLLRGPSNQNIEEELIARYSDSHLSISSFDITLAEERVDDFFSALGRADAVYVVWSNETRDLIWPQRELKRWAAKNSHMPVLAINCLPDEAYQLPYNSVSETRAVRSLWRLLVRSTERGLLWRMQAGATGKAALIASMLAGVSVLATVVCLTVLLGSGEGTGALSALRPPANQARPGMVAIVGSEMSSFRSQIEAIQSSSDYSAESKEIVLVLHNAIAKFIQKKLEQEFPNLEISSVTLWAAVGLHDSENECICEVGWTDNENLSCFPGNKQSITGCAATEGADVLWLRDSHDEVEVFKEGAEGCQWGMGSRLLARESMKGLLCIAEQRDRKSRSIGASVCIEMRWQDQVSPPREQIMALRARPDISLALALLYSSPEELLVRGPTEKSCRAKFPVPEAKAKHL